MSEHKACPFCGSDEVVMRTDAAAKLAGDCGAGPACDTETEAWRLWNDRAGGESEG